MTPKFEKPVPTKRHFVPQDFTVTTWEALASLL